MNNTLFSFVDYYLVCHDFPSYCEAQARVDAMYQIPQKWVKMSIINTSRSWKFNSDRTIQEYADQIWNLKVRCILCRFCLEDPWGVINVL